MVPLKDLLLKAISLNGSALVGYSNQMYFHMGAAFLYITRLNLKSQKLTCQIDYADVNAILKGEKPIGYVTCVDIEAFLADYNGKISMYRFPISALLIEKIKEILESAHFSQDKIESLKKLLQGHWERDLDAFLDQYPDLKIAYSTGLDGANTNLFRCFLCQREDTFNKFLKARFQG